MKKRFRKVMALALVLIMALSVVSGSAMAAAPSVTTEATQVLTKAAADNGFAKEYNGAVQMAAVSESGLAATVTLDYTKGAADRTTVVLVQAVDEAGKPLTGKSVHFVVGERTGNTVSVTYQENGCRYFAMMPVQYAFEQGVVAPLTIQLTRGTGNYTVSYVAKTTICDVMAELVAVNKTNQNVLRNLRFTCYLEDALLQRAASITEDDYSFEDPSDLFDVVSVTKTESGLKVEHKLTEATIQSWWTKSTAQVKQELQKEMTVSGSADIDENIVKAVVNSRNEIYTNGRIEITYRSGDVPGLDLPKVVVAAKQAQAVIDFDGIIADPTVSGISSMLNTADHNLFMIGRDHGYFWPDAPIKRCEVAMIFYRLLLDQNVEITASFVDVADDAWYVVPVETLASLGILEGVGDGKFEPERPITRAEFAAVCARFATSAEGGMTFVDVPETHWANDEIATAAYYGWVTGLGEDRFGPDMNITRASAAALVNRMLGRIPDKEAIDAGEATVFPDVTKDHWGWYNIGEATTNHDYSHNEDRTVETWK